MRGLLPSAGCLERGQRVLQAKGALTGEDALSCACVGVCIHYSLSFSPLPHSPLPVIKFPIQKSGCWLQIRALLQRWQEEGGLHPGLPLQEVLSREDSGQESSAEWCQCEKLQAGPATSWERGAAGDGGEWASHGLPWGWQEVPQGGVWGEPRGGRAGAGAWWRCKDPLKRVKVGEGNWWPGPGGCWAVPVNLALIKVAQAQLLQDLIAVLAVSVILIHWFSWLHRSVPWCWKCPNEVKFLTFLGQDLWHIHHCNTAGLCYLEGRLKLLWAPIPVWWTYSMQWFGSSGSSSSEKKK